MGTVLEISLFDPDLAPEVVTPILNELYALAEELDGLLSTHKSQSAISRLNRSAGRGGEQVDGVVAEILRLSIAYSNLTLGTFDVTIGPLSNLWKAAAANAVRPTEAEITHARSRVGTDMIIEHEPGVFYLAQKGVELDLGGIAKGYALDRMLPILAQRGIETALLSFGQSSTWALGAPPGSEGWRLLVRGIEHDYVGVITLRDQALSVSASVGYADENDTEGYSHIIDPRSGQPVAEPRQAIVVAPQAALAEALSKALLILDVDTGLALVAAQPGCEGLLIQQGGAWRSTPGWSDAVRFERLPH
jgi:thiamine biosynthesis lipoprotein